QQGANGEWVMREVVPVVEAERFLIFAGSGRTPSQDPYFIQYYRVNFDGSGVTPLTTEYGNHRATFSSDHSVFVDTYSRVDAPPVSELRDAKNGKVLMELKQADATDLLDTG